MSELMENLDMKEVKAVNEECNQYKNKISTLIAERNYKTERLNSLCANLSNMLGTEVTTENLVDIFNERTKRARSLLDTCKTIMANIKAQENGTSNTTVTDMNNAPQNYQQPASAPQASPQQNYQETASTPQVTPQQNYQEPVAVPPVSQPQTYQPQLHAPVTSQPQASQPQAYQPQLHSPNANNQPVSQPILHKPPVSQPQTYQKPVEQPNNNNNFAGASQVGAGTAFAGMAGFNQNNAQEPKQEFDKTYGFPVSDYKLPTSAINNASAPIASPKPQPTPTSGLGLGTLFGGINSGSIAQVVKDSANESSVDELE